MRKVTFILATAACLGLAAPAFATDKASGGRNTPQIMRDGGKTLAIDQFSAAGKKNKKKAVTKRTSWGG